MNDKKEVLGPAIISGRSSAQTLAIASAMLGMSASQMVQAQRSMPIRSEEMRQKLGQIFPEIILGQQVAATEAYIGTGYDAETNQHYAVVMKARKPGDKPIEETEGNEEWLVMIRSRRGFATAMAAKDDAAHQYPFFAVIDDEGKNFSYPYWTEANEKKKKVISRKIKILQDAEIRRRNRAAKFSANMEKQNERNRN